MYFKVGLCLVAGWRVICYQVLHNLHEFVDMNIIDAQVTGNAIVLNRYELTCHFPKNLERNSYENGKL